MERTTKAKLRTKVQGLQKRGIDIAIGWAYGQPRCTTIDEGQDLSPRLSMGEMSTWLHGFACAMDQLMSTEHEHIEPTFKNQLWHARKLLREKGIKALENPHAATGRTCGCGQCFCCAAAHVANEIK